MKELDIKTKLERHFKDAVDFEFVIQKGKLWILNARIARRTRKANIKISLDLYRENLINENETISKIQLEDINEILTILR
jgi:pyruvate,orthophosphate dikinase